MGSLTDKHDLDIEYCLDSSVARHLYQISDIGYQLPDLGITRGLRGDVNYGD